MDLPSIANAPAEVPIGGSTYRARRLTLAQLGEVLAWLEDRLPPTEDGAPHRFASPEAQLALATTEGLAVVLHLSLLSCHPSLTRDEARGLAARMGAEAQARLLDVAFRRRRGFDTGSDDEPKGRRRRSDLAEMDWGPIWEGLSQHQAGLYEAVGGLTLDQFESWAAEGKPAVSGDLTREEFVRMWEEDGGDDGN